MRDVVALSLGLDPAFTTKSCASGDEALAIAADWIPDLILCDVMMPDMDGAAMLVRLRETESTAKIPVVFMTAHPQAAEIEHFKTLGAAAVIAKPFDPKTLAKTVRGHLISVKIASVGYDFSKRLRADAARLATFRTQLRDRSDSPALPEGLLSCVHKLAGAAGVFEYQSVSTAASALEETIIERRDGRGTPGMLETDLDALLECIGRE
jgi:CheY-like chemotaxis protein